MRKEMQHICLRIYTGLLNRGWFFLNDLLLACDSIKEYKKNFFIPESTCRCFAWCKDLYMFLSFPSGAVAVWHRLPRLDPWTELEGTPLHLCFSREIWWVWPTLVGVRDNQLRCQNHYISQPSTVDWASHSLTQVWSLVFSCTVLIFLGDPEALTDRGGNTIIPPGSNPMSLDTSFKNYLTVILQHKIVYDILFVIPQTQHTHRKNKNLTD